MQVMKNVEAECLLLEAQVAHTDLIHLAERERRGERVQGKITAAFKRHKTALARAKRLLERDRK